MCVSLICFWFLLSVPFYVHTIVYLFILLMIDIFIISSLELS